MKRYCLTLDLKNDETLIAEYETWHQDVWPEIIKSIKDAGIEQMQIYRYGTRLMMIMETADGFSFEEKASADAADQKVRQWEALMWKYQQPLAGEPEGVKWVLMDKIFDLTA